MILTLCGSARFEELFHRWNEALSQCGHAVFSLAVYPSTKGEKNWYDAETKARFDEAHRLKIQHSDAIVVLNKFAYIGESTLAEIGFAREIGKRAYFLESWSEGQGISAMHTAECQAQAEAFDLVDSERRFLRSPIDTFTGRAGRVVAHELNRELFPSELLGPPGRLRSQLVEFLQAPLEGFRDERTQ